MQRRQVKHKGYKNNKMRLRLSRESHQKEERGVPRTERKRRKDKIRKKERKKEKKNKKNHKRKIVSALLMIEESERACRKRSNGSFRK